MQLTTNFHLKEFLLAGSVQPDKDVLANIKLIANRLQAIRDDLNAHFGFKIGIKITSGYRTKEWELKRGRSGNSQHTKGWAVDIVPVCPTSKMEEVKNYIYEKYHKEWSGGFAISYKPFFFHFDCRNIRARWVY